MLDKNQEKEQQERRVLFLQRVRHAGSCRECNRAPNPERQRSSYRKCCCYQCTERERGKEGEEPL